MWKAGVYSYFDGTNTFSDALIGNSVSERTLAASHLRMNSRQEQIIFLPVPIAIRCAGTCDVVIVI